MTRALAISRRLRRNSFHVTKENKRKCPHGVGGMGTKCHNHWLPNTSTLAIPSTVTSHANMWYDAPESQPLLTLNGQIRGYLFRRAYQWRCFRDIESTRSVPSGVPGLLKCALETRRMPISVALPSRARAKWALRLLVRQRRTSCESATSRFRRSPGRRRARERTR